MALKRTWPHSRSDSSDRSWVSARVSHAKSEMSRCRNQCGSRACIQNLVDTTLRFLIEQVGEVEVLTSLATHWPRFLARRTVGNAVEALGIVAFRASPVWVLAALADVCGLGRHLIPDRGCVERAAAPRCRHRFFERGSAARRARAHIGTGRSDDQRRRSMCLRCERSCAPFVKRREASRPSGCQPARA